MSNRRRHTLIRLLSATLLLWLSSCAVVDRIGPYDATDQPPTVDLRFEAQWWSDAEMEGLNLDDPPPKTHTITLTEWDPSDPVGTPHPAEFDVVIDIAHIGTAQRAVVEVRERWKVGLITEPGSAQWQDWQTIGTPLAVVLVSPDNTPSTVHRVRIQDTLDDLFLTSRWAFGYQADVKVSLDAENTVGTVTSRALPIQVGD